MNVELKLSTHEDAHIIKNLWPLYLHDLSEFDGKTPNLHGVICDTDDISTLAMQGEEQSGWWTRPDSLFPYIILADGRPAGFNLVGGRPFVPDGADVDFVIREFFVLHAYRGQDIAETAAVSGFEAHRGRWQVVTYPTHRRAISFWRKVLGHYVPGAYSEQEGDHPWGRKVIFAFDTRRGRVSRSGS